MMQNNISVKKKLLWNFCDRNMQDESVLGENMKGSLEYFCVICNTAQLISCNTLSNIRTFLTLE